MEDKEVGELWRTYTQIRRGFRSDNVDEDVEDLIRKLVEERAKRAAQAIGYKEPFTAKALRDFGIPPESWKP
jgi:hypothetical protein